MHFVIKAIIIWVCSFPLVAAELNAIESPPTTTNIDKEHNKAVLESLLSISQSLDTLANATVQLSQASNEIIDNEIRDDYQKLHKEILKSSSAINEAILKSSIVTQNRTELPNNLPKLKQRVDNLYQHQNYFSYADFAAISITSVSVIITALGIAIAVLSFWGYRNIKQTTESTAETIAEKVAGETTEQKIDSVVKNKLEELIDEGKFTKHLEDVVDAFILRNKNGSKSIDWAELDEDIDWDQLGDTDESVQKDGDIK